MFHNRMCLSNIFIKTKYFFPGFNELFFKNMIDPAITWTNVVSNSGPGRKDEQNEYCREALG